MDGMHKCYTDVALLSYLVTKDGGGTYGANRVRHYLAVQQDLGQLVRECCVPALSDRNMLRLDI